MPRHLIDISDLTRDEVHRLFALADEGPQVGSLDGLTFLAAFFQESTRTRLGFMSAAARQGATVLDVGSVDRLRREPLEDQQMVLAEVAELTAVRHGHATFARDLASRARGSVIDAGASGISHPTQALIDAYTLTRAFGRDLGGLRVLFLGPLLRSAVSFRTLGPILGVEVLQHDVAAGASRAERLRAGAEIEAADVVYIQSLSDTSYAESDLNSGPTGPALPGWMVKAIDETEAYIMHALPRGPELPDRIMRDRRSLVADQVHYGLAVRAAVLRWLIDPDDERG
jgi:aspartate carbamoyltransferase catalytic subunit